MKPPTKYILHTVRRIITKRRMINAGFIVDENDVHGVWSDDPLDLCYVAIDKDLETLIHSIEFAKRNIRHPIANIFVVSARGSKLDYYCRSNDIQFIDEEAVK